MKRSGCEQNERAIFLYKHVCATADTAHPTAASTRHRGEIGGKIQHGRRHENEGGKKISNFR